MDTTKYGKYFISEWVDLPKTLDWTRHVDEKAETFLLRLDGGIIEGVPCFMRCNWFWPEIMNTRIENRSTKPHAHDYDEILGFIGTKFEDPHDLCADIEIIIGGESHIVSRSSIIFLPAGLEHGPFRELRVDRPIFQFEIGLSSVQE